MGGPLAPLEGRRSWRVRRTYGRRRTGEMGLSYRGTPLAWYFRAREAAPLVRPDTGGPLWVGGCGRTWPPDRRPDLTLVPGEALPPPPVGRGRPGRWFRAWSGTRRPALQSSGSGQRALRSGRGAAWQRASFGTMRSEVQILSPRPNRPNRWSVPKTVYHPVSPGSCPQTAAPRHEREIVLDQRHLASEMITPIAVRLTLDQGIEGSNPSSPANSASNHNMLWSMRTGSTRCRGRSTERWPVAGGDGHGLGT